LNEVDHSWNWIYKIGGICFIIIGAWYGFANYWAYIVGIPGSGFATPPVATNQQYFNVLAAFPSASTFFYAMYSLVAFLCVPALIALYLALKGINKNVMIIATGIVAVWIIIEITVTEFNSLVLISLIQNYNNTTDVAQKAAYLAAANYDLTAIPISTFYSYAVGSIGFLLASIVMWRSSFRKIIAIIGIVCNTLGIITAFVLFMPALAILILPTLNLYGLWNVLIGIKFFLLGRK
jgi:hypothetical protein